MFTPLGSEKGGSFLFQRNSIIDYFPELFLHKVINIPKGSQHFVKNGSQRPEKQMGMG